MEKMSDLVMYFTVLKIYNIRYVLRNRQISSKI